jgi:hypothetical protein
MIYLVETQLLTPKQKIRLIKYLDEAWRKCTKVYGRLSTVTNEMEIIKKETEGSLPELRTYWAR